MVGDSGVGKTNLLSRFTKDIYDSNTRNTIGVDFSALTMTLKGQQVKIQFWDTAGQEKYRSIANAYYKNAHGAVIVYDISSLESFKNTNSWLKELIEHGEKNIQIAVFGNKKDLVEEREVKTDEGHKFSV